jgi:hypothetical protein
LRRLLAGALLEDRKMAKKTAEAAETTETTPTPEPRAKVRKAEDSPTYCPNCTKTAQEQGITDKLERVEDETGAYFCLRCKSKRLIPRKK